MALSAMHLKGEAVLKENRLRNLMRKGESTVGTRVLVVWPGFVEVIGHTGFYDYVEFLAEYGPFSLHDLDNFARAAELVGLSTMIKMDQEPRTYMAGRALASGIQNFLFADIRTAEDAEEAVNAVRAEPKGKSGIRMDRRIGYVGATASRADIVKMCDDAVVALMIEKKSAVDNLEAILSVEGVDMVQFGPSDYSLSIGVPGERGHPKVKEAELKTIKTALKMDVAPRAEISNPEDAKRYMELGVRNFSIGTDVSVLYGWWKDRGAELRKILSST
ncbi:MAG: aldolase/citrate lyase family protein [Candidatus Bathyarchaeota archaeon]|nr:aldolase/citrate lyase family protein [Candidatus Bathyarchaeota archaeon]MDH5686805.1 aldolase/citrate lyase family protein [Candidatus Bathyarchaeota archaeon]